jgi:hypothetical protein
MLAFRTSCVAVAWLLCTVAVPAGAENYWTCSQGSIEVVTTDGSGRAVSLAQDLARFDAALTQILQLPPPHLPTQVFELPTKIAAELIGDRNWVVYRPSSSGVIVVTDVQNLSSGVRNWGPLFGYAGGLVTTGQAGRSPYWFRVGVPALFARTEFDFDHVRTGGLDVVELRSLQDRPLIPSRDLLQMRASDPRLANRQYTLHFQAVSWFLAREVFVEGMLRPEFNHYLDSIRNGASEADAFTGSFKLSYEDLDKKLHDALSNPAHIYVIPVPHQEASDAQPRQLSAAEVDALLAELRMRFQR